MDRPRNTYEAWFWLFAAFACGWLLLLAVPA
jgi:hypothetical protein